MFIRSCDDKVIVNLKKISWLEVCPSIGSPIWKVYAHVDDGSTICVADDIHSYEEAQNEMMRIANQIAALEKGE